MLIIIAAIIIIIIIIAQRKNCVFASKIGLRYLTV
jgi:hypothetical protein